MNKPGRNSPCPCGSGLKYKRCCEEKDLLDDDLGTFGTEEQAEMVVFESVYNATLLGVWSAFHGKEVAPPDTETMERFYVEVYGYELDLTLINDIAFPLPAKASAQIIALHGLKDEKVVDVPAEDVPPAKAD